MFSSKLGCADSKWDTDAYDSDIVAVRCVPLLDQSETEKWNKKLYFTEFTE